MDYLNSWDFYFYVLWLSSAVGFGLTLGFYLFSWVDKVIDNLLGMKFKKDKKDCL